MHLFIKYVSVFTLFFTVLIPLPEVSANPLKHAVIWTDDLWDLIRSTSKYTDSQLDALSKVIHKTGLIIDDISPELTKALRLHLDDISYSGLKVVLEDPRLLTLLSKHTDLIEPTLDAIKFYPINNWSLRLTNIMAQYPFGSTEKTAEILTTIGSKVPENTAHILLRGIDGKIVKPNQLGEVFDTLEHWETLGNNRWTIKGDLWEVVARSQLENGKFKHALDLMPNSKVINGQYDGVRGFDGIGISPDGVPIIFEMTTNAKKTFENKSANQMTSEWCFESWNKLVDHRPEMIEQLGKIGLASDFNGKITIDLALRMHRKVLASSSKVREGVAKYRMNARLDFNDIVTLK